MLPAGAGGDRLTRASGIGGNPAGRETTAAAPEGGRVEKKAEEGGVPPSWVGRLRLGEVELADGRVLGARFADQLAERHAAAVADAGAVHRVVLAEEVALHVADGSSSAVSTWESAFTWRPKGMVSVEHTFFVA